MFASELLWSFGVVLPEIEKLHRVDFHAHCVLKVLIGDQAILVMVELVKQGFELVVIHVETPMMQIDLQLLWFDLT